MRRLGSISLVRPLTLGLDIINIENTEGNFCIGTREVFGVKAGAARFTIQDQVTDHILEPSSADTARTGDIEFSGALCLAREIADETIFYLLRSAQYFSMFGASFESDNPVTMYAKGTEGTIITDGTRIKLTGTGMGQVQFQPSVQVLSSGTDFIEVQLTEGNYTFK